MAGALNQDDETKKLAADLKPVLIGAVALGAGRVASAIGTDAPEDDDDDVTDLAGALAYKFAQQFIETTVGQLAQLQVDGGSDDDIDALFGTRSDMADAMAETTVSDAINGGAQQFAGDSGATKTWVVTDNNPCQACDDADGETVGADEDFSNGAPHGPIHDGCNCTTEWDGAEERSKRRVMSTRATLTEADRDKLSDSDFAYVDSEGEGHLPIHDEAHVRAALGRFNQQQFEKDSDKGPAAKKIVAAAKKFGIELDPTSAVGKAAGMKATESKSLRFVYCLAPESPPERRAASLSFGDTQSRVYEALCGTLPWPADCWIMDMGADWVVYQDWNAEGMYQLSYAMDGDGLVTFDGPPTRVDQVTSFVPVEMKSLRSAKGTDGNGDGMVQCPTCDGSGTIREGNMECPTCKGDKKITEAAATKMAEKKTSSRPRQRRDLPRGDERRTYTAVMECRGDIQGDEVVLRGMPIKYTDFYSVFDGRRGQFREQMMPGVADDVLKRGDLDCRFLEAHGKGNDKAMARTANGTLDILPTNAGVTCEARVDMRRGDVRDLVLAVERQDVNQMSVGFVVADDGDDWRWADDGVQERSVYSIGDLLDVSAVTYPCSTGTQLELAQRALAVRLSSLPSDTRERLRRLWYVAKDIREGKVLSQQNGQDLMEALEALHEADDIDIPEMVRNLQTIDSSVDKGQAALAAVLGRANPDGDPGDLEPALVPPPDNERTRQRQYLALVRAKQLLAV